MAKLNERQVKEKIIEAHGNVAAVARAFGVSRQSAHEYIAARPALAHVLTEARETMLDNAESKLYMEAMAGNTAALIFLLKTQGKKRGYIERTQSEIGGIENGNPLEIKSINYRAAIAPLAPVEAGSMGNRNASGEDQNDLHGQEMG